MNDNKPYLVDAVIGNSKMLASLGKTGRLYRLWWPHIDTPQHVDTIRMGLQFDQNPTEWFDSEDGHWDHEISYTKRSNVLEINAVNKARKLSINSVHFAHFNKDLIVRAYTFKNENTVAQQFKVLMHSSFNVADSTLYNTTMFNLEEDALVHFKKNHYFALSSEEICEQFQAGLSLECAEAGILKGATIDMKSTGGLSWSVTLKPGQALSLPIYIAAGSTEHEAYAQLHFAKSQGYQSLLHATNNYWLTYLEQANPCPVSDSEMVELYERSILMFKLMSDNETGTIIAAPEFDETFSRCGGYSYCWGRDAAFITTALDKVGLYDITDKFYDWTLTAQSEDGSWQQRHYHDGSLAPSWGLQIDEGASIIWGMWEHYKVKQDAQFAQRVIPAVLKGASFLLSFIDEQTGLPKPSIDLWEERLASHTYSSAAVYGGLTAASQFALLANEVELSKKYTQAAAIIQTEIEATGYNSQLNSYYRGLNISVSQQKYEEAISNGHTGTVKQGPKNYKQYILDFDPIIDVSLLGISVPFAAVAPYSERMINTANAIEQKLTSPIVKGIKRYEDDIYAGGNPWILTTLWLAHYRFSIGEVNEAKQLLKWAIDHRTETGLLPEQVHKENGSPAWVVPLTWSHAMYILAIFMLAEAEQK